MLHELFAHLRRSARVWDYLLGKDDRPKSQRFPLGFEAFECRNPAASLNPASSLAFINEFRYGDAGADENEFIELAGTAGTDLSGWSIAVYDGATGSPYFTMALEGVISDQQGGYGAIAFHLPTELLADGGPSGMALVDDLGNVVQFLSYGGAFTATSGPAAGMSSQNVGASETGSDAPGSSLQLTGTGIESGEFTWNLPAPATPGMLNVGQSFEAPIPIPIEDDIKVHDVTFSGPGQFTVAPDPGDTAPAAPPHWVDDNLDGDTDDAGDRSLPIGFVRNTQVSVAANFAVTGPSLIDPTAVRVRGDGPDSLDIGETVASYDAATQTIQLSPTALTGLLPNTVYYYEQFSLAWEVSLDGGATWSAAGTSGNQTYVSLATPALGTVYHTLVHLSTTAAAGAENNQKVIDDVWDKRFATRKVDDVKGNRLWYYKNWEPADPVKKIGTITAPDLVKWGAKILEDKDGPCYAWAQFFIDAVAAQGVTQQKNYLAVMPKLGNQILVNNWKFEGNGTSGDPTFPYKNLLADPKQLNGYQKQDAMTKEWAYYWGTTAEVTDLQGIPGQGENPNPRSMFAGHVVATFNGVIYDPSYGLKYESLDKWEESAVAGYGTSKALPGKTDEFQWFFAKNTADLGVYLETRATYGGGEFTTMERFNPDGTPWKGPG